MVEICRLRTVLNGGLHVNIEWVAHACFRVWRDGGPLIVMDPYNPATLKQCGVFEDDNSTI